MTQETPTFTLPSFDDLANALVSENVRAISPAQLHGFLVGQLAAGARPEPEAWLRSACELMGISAVEHEESKLALLIMYQQTLAQLQAPDMGFKLIQPDDDELLAQRAEQLGLWCAHFLSGFGMTAKQTDESLSQDVRDAMTDLNQIAQIELEAEESEDNEVDFAEIEEYVRMAALMIFTECNEKPDDQAETAAPAKPLQVH